MDEPIPVIIAVEDYLSEAVLRTILFQSDRTYIIGNCLGRQGLGYLKKKISSFNLASKGIPFIILADLDQVECAPELLDSWFNFQKSDNLLFRVAVREVESWVMAHRSAFSSFLGIAKELIPPDTDTIDNPKRFLINLAVRSKNRVIREAIVPNRKSTATIGPDYNGTLISFVQSRWKVRNALKYSRSLKRSFIAINSFKPV